MNVAYAGKVIRNLGGSIKNSQVQDMLYCIKLFSTLRKNQSLSQESLQNLQNRLLRSQITYVFQHSQFYRRKFKQANISPRDIKTVNDLVKIPITTKEEVRKYYQDFIIRNSLKQTITTSGSSGITVSIYRTKSEATLRKCLLLRHLYKIGLNYKDKLLVVSNSGSKFPFFEPLESFQKFHTAYNNLKKALRIIKQKKITAIYSSPTTLELLGEELQNSDTQIRKLLSFAELLDRNRRKRIEKYFDAPVYDLYALKEVPIVGAECIHRRGFHVNTDVLVLESIYQGKQVQDKSGNIVVTDLFNKWAPILRYDTGDVGKIDKKNCTCSSAFPLLKNLQGRKNDFIITKDGRRIAPMELMYVMYDFPFIKGYKIVQKNVNKLTVGIYGAANSIQKEQLEKKLKSLIKSNIEIYNLDSIPQYGDTGKAKFIESSCSVQ